MMKEIKSEIILFKLTMIQKIIIDVISLQILYFLKKKSNLNWWQSSRTKQAKYLSPYIELIDLIFYLND